jgi:hypothetical protein
MFEDSELLLIGVHREYVVESQGGVILPLKHCALILESIVINPSEPPVPTDNEHLRLIPREGARLLRRRV